MKDAGEIYGYRIEAPNYSLVDQRALQDWVIERNLRSVQGVADVVAFSGSVKQYQIEVDPDKLKDYKLTLPDIYQAVASNNANTGGGYIEHGYEALVVRGAGLLKSANEIGDIGVASRNGVPVLVKHVANVVIGPQPRNGIVGYNERDDLVEGVVLLIKGKDAITVLDQTIFNLFFIDEMGEQLPKNNLINLKYIITIAKKISLYIMIQIWRGG